MNGLFWAYAALGVACSVGVVVTVFLAVTTLLGGGGLEALRAVPALTVFSLIAFLCYVRAKEER